MNPIYNIKMWKNLIIELSFDNLYNAYLCDLSDDFRILWNNHEQWEYLKNHAEEFLKTWKDPVPDTVWVVSQKYLFGLPGLNNMSDIKENLKAPVRLAFCKYMLNKSKEYESQ